MKNIEEYFRIARLLIGLAVSALFMPASANAQSSPTVQLNFTGTYIATTCPLISSPDMTVTLPTVSAQSLPTAGAVAGSKIFTIVMKCDSGVTGARVYFESGATTDPVTGYLNPQAISGVNSASNVQVMLLNEDGSPIKVGDRSTMKIIPVTSTDPTSANFIARYYATGRATAGMVNTFVTYVVEMP